MSESAKRPLVWAAMVLGLGAGISRPLWAQKKPASTDAEVEANVLRALAGVPELSAQNIQTSTVYGTVTLSGNIHDEPLRSRAEAIVARTEGVTKVIDELTLGDIPAETSAAPLQTEGPQDTTSSSGTATPGPMLQSDGSYAPATSAEMQQENTPQPYSQQPNSQPAPVTRSGQGLPQYGAPAQPRYGAGSGAPVDNQRDNQQGNNGPTYNGPTYNGPGSTGAGSYGRPTPYGGQNGYSPALPPAYGGNGRPPYGFPQQNGYSQGGYERDGQVAGQPAGVPVTVPSGASLQVRLDRGIDSNHIQPGTTFTGTVVSDIIAGGFVALPRGAAIEGVVVDARRAGALKGEGELALQLTSVALGGQTFPLSTAVWNQQGRSKTLGTVDSALGLGALGAVFGGLAGGGAGAAIGAGVGGAVGVGASAASPGGRVIVPPESVLSFALAQPLAVRTVSQGEMQRLAYGAGPRPGQPALVRRRYYPGLGAYGPYAGYGPYGYRSYGYGPLGPVGYPYGAYFYRR